MSIVLQGSTSGSITLQEPAVAGTNTLSLPAVTATLATEVNGVLYPLTSGTAVASTSGTSIDFTSIPSWVKRITVMFDDVSTSGTSNMLVQLGDSGGIETTGYLSTGALYQAGVTVTSSTAGFLINNNTAANTLAGAMQIFTLDSGTSWVASGVFSSSGTTQMQMTGGSKTTSATLNRIRITTVGGTDTFDAGSINILYE